MFIALHIDVIVAQFLLQHNQLSSMNGDEFNFTHGTKVIQGLIGILKFWVDMP